MYEVDSRVQRKQLKSWQRRRKRRIRIILGAVLICILVVLFLLVLKSLAPTKRVDLSDYVIAEVSGYNTKGKVDAYIDGDKASELMKEVSDKYDSTIFKFKKCEPEDFNQFYNSLTVSVQAPENLSNGSKYSYTVNYDEKLAKKIRLKVEKNTREESVGGLPVATVYSVEQVFENISIFCEGKSPAISIAIINENTSPYLADVEYYIENRLDSYKDGDVVRVRALYNAQDLLEKHFVINCPMEECFKDYVIESGEHYVSSADELTDEFIKSAVEAAKSAFTTKSAKEFGVRVYFEANIPPVYVNKDSTFEWVNFRPLSAYLKVAKEGVAGENSNNFNDLDIVFDCTMTQADHKNINVEAVVRFKDVVVNKDGNVSCDFSNPAIVSASHFDARIKKNVITNYEDKYNIEKLNIN